MLFRDVLFRQEFGVHFPQDISFLLKCFGTVFAAGTRHQVGAAESRQTGSYYRCYLNKRQPRPKTNTKNPDSRKLLPASTPEVYDARPRQKLQRRLGEATTHPVCCVLVIPSAV
ncbi:hypothetical protein MRX96_024859 [Rhipicephalus microplus]